MLIKLRLPKTLLWVFNLFVIFIMMQSQIVAVHFASMLNTAVDPRIYHGLRSLWAIPMQLFMVRGIVLDVRHQSQVAR